MKIKNQKTKFKCYQLNQTKLKKLSWNKKLKLIFKDFNSYQNNHQKMILNFHKCLLNRDQCLLLNYFVIENNFKLKLQVNNNNKKLNLHLNFRNLILKNNILNRSKKKLKNIKKIQKTYRNSNCQMIIN